MNARIRNAILFVMTLCVVASVLGCAGSNLDAMRAKEIKPPKRPPPPPRQIREPINPELRGQAKAELLRAFSSADPVFRANAIEGLQRGVGAEAGPQVLKGLNDSDALVRFAAAMAAGQLRLASAHDPLVGMLQDDDDNVRVAVRFALHRVGDKRFSRDLEKTARDFNNSVRANTALALGLIEDKSALNVLRAMTTDLEPSVRIQVAEAMWRHGDEEALQVLVAGTVSGFADDQIVSTLALAGPRDQRVIEHVRGKLTSDWPEVSLAAARAMGELQSDEGYAIAMSASQSSDPRQRALAAFALGAITRSDAQPTLSRLLKDSDANVRLAAATAILQLKAPT